jgi:uncharacterized membrane protein YjjP (DUF1212 family)
MSQSTDIHGFLIRLGASLVHYGTPAQQVEQFLGAIGTDLGMSGTYSATPTLLMLDVEQDGERAFRIERVHGFSIDLHRLQGLDRLANEVARGERSPAQGLVILDRILAEPPCFGPWLSWLSFILASGSAAVFFGGGAPEIVFGAVGGGALGLVSQVAERRQVNPRLIEFFGAFIVALVIALLVPLVGPVDVDAAVLGGVIVLVPGFTIAIGVSELVTQHMTAGVSRLGAATVTAMMLGFGVVFGLRLGEQLVGSFSPVEAVGLDMGLRWLLVPVVVLSISVLFRAPVRQWGWILLVAALGFGAYELASQWLRPELSVFLGALVLGCGSNLHARLRDVPSAITRLPGLLFLVPGSLSFLGITELMDGNAMDAVTAAGQVAIVATARVTGLVVAGSALPPRKVL